MDKKTMAAFFGAVAFSGLLVAGEPAFEAMKWEKTAFDSGVWTIDAEGVMTAGKDAAIWSAADYEDFILDFDYKLDPAANSGVIIYAIDPANWIPGSVEVQLLDDNHPKWKNDRPQLKNSSLYGHYAPLATPAKPAGEWNHMTIVAKGQHVEVELNGVKTVDADLSAWPNAKENPDGSKIPGWLSRPWAEIPTIGRVGFQGMHGGARPYFRNVRIAKIPDLKPYVDGASERTAIIRAQRAMAAELEAATALEIDPDSITGEASGYIEKESPAAAFGVERGKKLCCDMKGTPSIICALKAPETVSLYTIASANDASKRDPAEWELFASDDGKEWRSVDKRAGERFVTRNELHAFKLAAGVKAKFFKLVILKNGGDGKVQFSRVSFRK